MTDIAHSALTRLATYGTLAPGRVNHHQLAQLKGRWLNGTVRGQLFEDGWGAALGYPGLILDEEADPIEVHIFESRDLPDHWGRLDAFEGDGYSRDVTTAQTDDGPLEVSIYTVKR